MATDMVTSLLELAVGHAQRLEHQMKGFEALADSGWDRVGNEGAMLCIAAVIGATRNSQSLDAPQAIHLENEVLDTFVEDMEDPYREEVRSALLERANVFNDIVCEWPPERWSQQIGNQFALNCDIFDSSAGRAGAAAYGSVRQDAGRIIDAWASERRG